MGAKAFTRKQEQEGAKMKTCKGCGAPILSGDDCKFCGLSQQEQPEQPKQKRKGRGPSKKPTLFNTSLRLSREVMDYFNTNHPYTKQAKIREILTEYVNSQQQGANNGNSKEIN
jgi:uncharacterized protein (DUF4415 family)